MFATNFILGSSDMSTKQANANAELASQIVAALQKANYLASNGTEAVMTLLTSKAAKAGEWRTLLEQQIVTSTSVTADDATSNQGT